MNLHDRVVALPMSQAQVARHLGVDGAYFSRMIRGIRPCARTCWSGWSGWRRLRRT